MTLLLGKELIREAKGSEGHRALPHLPFTFPFPFLKYALPWLASYICYPLVPSDTMKVRCST